MNDIVTSQIKPNGVTAPHIKIKGSTYDPRGSKPVFLINFRDGTRLILKAEFRSDGRTLTQVAQIARWGGKMMKQVSPQAKVKPLTPSELTTLKRLGVFHYEVSLRGSVTREYLNTLIDSNSFAFYKMEYIENLTDMASITEDQPMLMAHHRLAWELLRKFREEPPILKQLGKIVAVDLFIGNHDRIGPDGEIVNVGNIFFKADQYYTPLGLDFYEAQGQFSNLFSDPPTNWAGLLLARESFIKRHLFGTAVIDNLNKWFVKQLNNVIPQDQLIRPTSSTVFVNGLDEGGTALKEYLLQKVMKGPQIGRQRIPRGLETRMRRLHWL